MSKIPRRVEATLFYQRDPELDFQHLAGVWVKAFDKTSVPMLPRLVTSTDLGCTVGGLTLTFVRHADLVATPPVPGQDAPDTQSVAYTLRIGAQDDSAQTATQLALCYVALMQVLHIAQADRIHWGYSNVIHTFSSFLQETTGGTPQPMTKADAPDGNRPDTQTKDAETGYGASNVALFPAHAMANRVITHCNPPEKPPLIEAERISAGVQPAAQPRFRQKLSNFLPRFRPK